MKNIIYWIIAIIIALIAIAGVIYFMNQNNKQETIKIGFIGPLTGAGTAWGDIEVNVIKLAVDEINANGGINEKKIKVYYEDGKCDGNTALSAAQKLVSIDGIKILLVSCSQEVIPIAPFTEKNKVIVFSSYASSSLITNAGDYVFRNSYSNKDYAKVIAKTMIKDNKKVAVISEISDYASDLRDLFKIEFESLGGKVVSDENFQPESKDVKTQITNILSKNPDAILINPNGPITGMPILKQLKELGYKGKIYGNFFGGSKEVQLSDEAQGMIFFADPTIEESPLKKELFEKYKKVYGKYPDLEFPAGTRYDSVYILKGAIESCNEDTDCIKNYLYNLKNFTGVLGTYGFDKNGDVTRIFPSAKLIINKTAVPYKEVSQ